MLIWDALNNIIDWMNAHGSNDYASITFILIIFAVVWDKFLNPVVSKIIAIIKEAVSDWKVGRQQRKQKEAAR